jgi:hypothetical protein
MTNRFFSARVFSLAFGLGYATAVIINFPLFRYYPLVKHFSMHDLTDKSLGPAMSWYGWIAIAAIFAGFVTLLVPKRIGDRIPAGVFWIVIVVLFAAAFYRERQWFLPIA